MGKGWEYTCFLTLIASQALRYPELTGGPDLLGAFLLEGLHTAPSRARRCWQTWALAWSPQGERSTPIQGKDDPGSKRGSQG